MELLYRRIDLRLARPFGISTGSTSMRHSVLVAVRHAGQTGYGEAAPARMYGQSPDSVVAALPVAARIMAKVGDPARPGRIADPLAAALPGELATVAAIDAAVHDLAGKIAGQPAWRCLGSAPARMPVSSFSIGIDSVDVIEQKVREAAGWPVLKIKLGSADDERIVDAVRRCTQAPIRVDANGGWDFARATRMCRWLAERNCELVEQPLARGCEGQMPRLKADSPLPLYADESCHRLSDLSLLAAGFHGVNLKLSKTGGITAGRRLVVAARAMGLRVMVGCMIESSVGIAAAAQLAPLCDLADLDGHLLLASDIATGLEFSDHRLVLTEAPGLGLRLNEELLDESGWTRVGWEA